MSSLVIELQRDALDQNILVTSLLRKALVVAKKLEIPDFEEWISDELNGYDTKDVPLYRELQGSVRVFNPYRGWQPMFFEDTGIADKLSRRQVVNSICEFENAINESSDNSHYYLAFPPAIENLLSRNSSFPGLAQYALCVSKSSYHRIIEAVKTIVLEWAIKLEKDGILGSDMAFTDTEKEKAKTTTYNVNNFYGNVQNSQIQQQSTDSIQTTDARTIDLNELKEFLGSLMSHVSEIGISKESQQELEAEVHTMESQITSPKPKENIIKQCLMSMQRILEGASGTVAGQLLLELSRIAS